MIRSDWHIHSEYSYDAHNALAEISEGAAAQGFAVVGITDHLNYNDEKFKGDVKASAAAVKEAQKSGASMILGVELTPIGKPEFDYIAKTGTREGFVEPICNAPYDIELAMTKEELTALGIRYAIGASHWRVDIPDRKKHALELDACIKEWYRQQLYLAADPRVTILGHPWYHGNGLWYEDFSIIPRSANDEIASALLENGKYAECNLHFFTDAKATEKFRRQYAEFLRELFERGVKITYGSDSHAKYAKEPEKYTKITESYLRAAGFCDGDISEISEKDLW